MSATAVAFVAFFTLILVILLKQSNPKWVNRLLGGEPRSPESPPRSPIEPHDLLDELPTGILVLSPEFRVDYVNQAFSDEVGISKDNIEGELLETVFSDAEGLKQALSQDTAEQDNKPHNASLTYSDRSGQKDKLQLTISRSDTGEDTSYICVVPTFTNLVGAEDQIRQSERIRTLGEMISGLAHEINNPLTGVIGFVNLLQEDERTEPVSNELEIIEENASRCKDIIDNLLNFVRPGKSGVEDLDLNEILSTSVKLIRRNLDIASIDIETQYDPELPTVPANRTQIEEVFINLLTNAEQELKENVEEGPRKIRVISKPIEDETVLIRIEDSGSGIPESRREKVFDAFHTTKSDSEGTGLGLSISQGIINELGGEITIGESEWGGAQFNIKLPTTETGKSLETQTSQASDHNELPEGYEEILVVEDEESIRDLFQKFADKLGLEGRFKGTPLDAIDELEHGQFSDPDLIVLDLVYPGQLKGQDLVIWLKENRSDLLENLIFITGNPHDDQLENIREETDAPLVTKPLSMDDFLHAVNEISRDH